MIDLYDFLVDFLVNIHLIVTRILFLRNYLISAKKKKHIDVLQLLSLAFQ